MAQKNEPKGYTQINIRIPIELKKKLKDKGINLTKTCLDALKAILKK